MSRTRVAVAMSGGVDSSVAAALLVEQGCEVVGITMRLWRENAQTQSASEESAGQTAALLGIEHVTVDLGEEFGRCVVDSFVQDYAAGRTPNPCIDCNARIKFGALLRYVEKELGATALATGHYVRTRHEPETGRWKLLRGLDSSKDQSYFLYRLTQDQLGTVIFPLGAWSKSAVQRAAGERGIKALLRPESQDICFVPNERYGSFLVRMAPELAKPGPIVDSAGRALGVHRGIAFYTVGQRRGIGVAAKRRLYVTQVDAASNTVVVGPADELAKRYVTVADPALISGEPLPDRVVVSAKIRYNAQDSPAVLTPLGTGEAALEFDRAQNAPANGQSAVFYNGEEVLGGGIIVGSC